MNSKLIIQATNIHYGGGSSLLTALLDECPKNIQVVALLDERMLLPNSISERLSIKYFSPTILQRLRAEWWVKRNLKSQDTVLCFGNLPPLFKLLGNVIVFVQNRFLIDKVSLSEFSFKTKLRLSVERLWFSSRLCNVDEFIVQSPSMKTALLSLKQVKNYPVHIRPFTNGACSYKRKLDPNAISKEKMQFDFIYVASGEPHKNHRRLVNAWCLLAEQELFPSLCLTLNENISDDLCAWINEQKDYYGLEITNVGSLPHEEIRLIYNHVGALIYPSLLESLGLPLIEARQANLPVLASELDYVRDVLDPEQTFNPESSVSIAKAMKRFMNQEEQPIPLLDITKFISNILINDT